MMLPSVYFGLLFLLFGTLFACGKCHSHLAAWKNLSESEKAAINIVPLCRNIGAMIALCGVLFLINGLAGGGSHHWFILSMSAWMLAAGGDVYYIEKSGRYSNR